MRVESSAVKLSSLCSSVSSQKTVQITLTRPVMQDDTVEITPTALNKQQSIDTEECKTEDFLTEKQRIAKFLIELFFGVKIPDRIKIEKQNPETEQETSPAERFEVISIDFTEKFEKEDVDFQAEGQVKTADGRVLNFNLSVGLSRSFYEARMSIDRQVRGKDPLVLNLSGIFKGLTENTIDFDIDADGVKDKIHFVKDGSGILVIDKNGDGRINDGKEVVGTQTGNALSELAGYDEDKNGWIDEGDTIFVKLAVWEKDKAGNDIITQIKEKGIGAISLASAITPFQIKNSDTPYGIINDTGVFLFEDGRASSFHRVDLFV